MSFETFNASEWLLDRNVAEGRGDHPAMVGAGQQVTYRQLLDLVERTAAALRHQGVRPEERVAMAVLDSIEFVAVFLGAMRIGAVPLPMNPLLPGRDLGVIVADSRARVLVASAERSQSVHDLAAAAPEVNTVIMTDPADGEQHQLPSPTDAGTGSATPPWSAVAWVDFLAAGDAATVDGSPYETWTGSPGFWLCTSGSTGRPKLAMHRHIDLKVTYDTYGQNVLGVGPDDRCFSVGPMFHAYGLGNSVTFPFAVGATCVFEPTRPPTPQLVADIMAEHQPTLFFCIPTFYAALCASDLPDEAFRSVRLGVSAAEPLPAETFNTFLSRFGVTILDGIGSTEMLHIYLSNSQSELRPGTSGVPVPGYEVKLIDELGDIQKPGEPGQLCVRGDSAALGYWCRADISRSTFQGSWMHTGDLYQEDGGYYTYMGRVDDMLRVGGEWVSPAEVEGVLIQHATVLEAAVVGERDDANILRPVAYVIAIEGQTASPDELTEFCRLNLAGYKRPTRYVLVQDLPKTATGKIQRFKLRQQ